MTMTHTNIDKYVAISESIIAIVGRAPAYEKPFEKHWCYDNREPQED